MAVMLGLAAALGLVACGGGSKEKTSGTSPPTTVAAGAGPTVNTSFTGQGSAQFCGLLRTFNDDSKRLATSLTDPNSLRDLLRKLETGVKQASSLAPAEIRPDVKLLADVYRDSVAALEKVNFDFTKVPSATLTRLSAPEVSAAATRLEAYSRDICKVPG